MFSTYPEQDYQDGMKSDILKKENLGKQRNHKTTEIVGCFCLLFLGLQPAPGIWWKPRPPGKSPSFSRLEFLGQISDHFFKWKEDFFQKT